jgi:multimeric flavodoxin WrbA
MSTDVKILGVSWSPRHGNTDIQVQEALDAAAQLPGVTTEFYSVAGKKIGPCKSTYACERKPKPDRLCHCYKPSDDDFFEIANLVTQADGIIFGCPVYWMSVTSELKAFQDRAMSVEMLGFPWRNKVAGFLTCAWDRNGGQEHTIREMLNWAMMHDFMVVGVGPERPERSIGGYIGGMAIQGAPFPDEDLDAIRQDEVGMFATRCIGWRVAEMTKVIKAGLNAMGTDDLKWPKGALA